MSQKYTLNGDDLFPVEEASTPLRLVQFIAEQAVLAAEQGEEETLVLCGSHAADLVGDYKELLGEWDQARAECGPELGVLKVCRAQWEDGEAGGEPAILLLEYILQFVTDSLFELEFQRKFHL
jgi:hypothetical protein